MNPFRIIFVILLVNAVGIILRYFELDTYFVFVGFRFHLSALLPFILLVNEENLKNLFSALRKPYFRKKLLPFIWIISAPAVLLAVLYVAGEIKSADPDYFYEFGLSSVFDFPLYLIWNFPQLCFLFLTLRIFSGMTGFSYLDAFLGLILLFGYELIPFDSSFSPAVSISLVILCLTASFFVTNMQNIYWFAVVIFGSVWSIILLFGSRSELLINIFFAKEYSSWEGFFKIPADISLYIIPSYFILILVFTAFYSHVFRKPAQKKVI